MDSPIVLEEDRWIVGSIHFSYGTVGMCMCIGGEPYRFFNNGTSTSMIPLSVLQNEIPS